MLVKLFYAFNIYVSFMLEFYVVVEFLEPIVVSKCAPRPSKRRLDSLTQAVLRAALVFLIVLVPTTVPEFQDLIAFVGAITCSFLCLIIPSLLHMLCFWKAKDRRGCIPWPIWLAHDVFAILLGVAGMITGLYTSLHSIYQNFGKNTQIHCAPYYE